MVTTVSLPDGLHERLKQLADEEHRSMNATIVVAIEEYISAHSHRARVRDIASEIAGRHAELLRRLAE
jgi:predicted transcriptional regulator